MAISLSISIMYEKPEYTKEVYRSYKTKKDRKYNETKQG
jgi:hypothetical protein